MLKGLNTGQEELFSPYYDMEWKFISKEYKTPFQILPKDSTIEKRGMDNFFISFQTIKNISKAEARIIKCGKIITRDCILDVTDIKPTKTIVISKNNSLDNAPKKENHDKIMNDSLPMPNIQPQSNPIRDILNWFFHLRFLIK